MSCCDWLTFREGFIAHWERQNPMPDKTLIDWKQARHDWKKLHMTGYEGAFMQLKALASEANYRNANV